MKLSAPPLPPPEPIPENSLEAAGGTVEPSAQLERAPAKPASWPAWFGAADWALVFLTLALTFLTASFAVRNSDLWIHLAAGKRLTTGDYKLGTDPFSYTAADRTWVNHSWLFDLGSFLLYSGDGFLLVLVKALAVVLAFGLILAIRKPGQPYWPWAIFAILAMLASTTQFTFRPLIASMVLLAWTLLLLFRIPSRPGSWRLPILIGITFCLWSNLDGYFLLGPATLLLLTIGEFARQKFGAEASADPFGSLPDLGTLVKATIVGTLACMVNPHHIGVWELPFELIGNAEGDPRIRLLLTAPTQGAFWRNEGIAYNVGGLSYAILLLAGLYVSFLSAAVGRFFGSAAEVEPLPLPHVLLWLGFAALSVFTFFAIPFLALVTVPLVASRWNLFSSRIVLQSASDRGTRLLLTGSVAGRAFCLVAVLLLGVAAWPGWLHAPASCWWESAKPHPATARRVEWRIDVDPEFQRNAEWLQEVRTSGKLPPDARGIIASADLANYCAWFAPEEKVFANGRFKFHTPEMKDFVQLRRGLGAFQEKSEGPDFREASDVLARWKSTYVGVAVLTTDNERRQIYHTPFPLRDLWLNWTNWSPWYLNGRTTIVGYRPSVAATNATFASLELNPEVLAYGYSVKPIPAVKCELPLLIQGPLDELLIARRPTPAGAEEAMAWLSYKDRQQSLNILAQQTAALLRLNQPGIATSPIGPAIFESRDEFLATQRRLSHPAPADGSFRTYPILALRAARRAIAENPDHPDGYYALAQALSDRDLPLTEGDRNVAVITAYRQCFIRMPPPSEYRRSYYLASPTDVAINLARLYLGQRLRNGDFQGSRVDSGSIGELAGAGLMYQIPTPGGAAGRVEIVRVPPESTPRLPPNAVQIASGLYILPLDLARQMLAAAEEYAKVEIVESEVRANLLKSLEDERKAVETSYRGVVEKYRPQAEKYPRLNQRYSLAIGFGLVGDALSQLKEADLAKELGEGSSDFVLKMIAVELAVGHIEDASANLATMREELNKLADQPGAGSQRVQVLRRRLAELEFQKLFLEGNYGEAGRELEALAGGSVGKYLSLSDSSRADLKGFDPAKLDDLPYQLFGSGWPAFAMFASTDTPFSLITRYWASYVQVVRYSVARDEILNRMRDDSQFFFRRGLLSLLEGDIEGAKQRFQNAYRPPPPGWKVLPLRVREAEVFLKQIEAAEKRSKP